MIFKDKANACRQNLQMGICLPRNLPQLTFGEFKKFEINLED
jgi:hypothetical protein